MLFRFVLLYTVIFFVAPAFLFGRAAAILKGIAIGVSLWMVFLIFWCLGEIFGWFSPSISTALLIGFVFFAIDIILISVMASLVVSKPDKTSIAEDAKVVYDGLPPKAKTATKRIAAAFIRRMAEKQREKKHDLAADVLTEVSKSIPS